MLRWLRKAFTQNLLLKFTALVCAVVVWVYVDGLVPARRKIRVPVTVPQMELVLGSIEVTIEGPSRRVRGLRPGAVSVEILDLGPRLTGDGILTIVESDIRVPEHRNIAVVGFAPRLIPFPKPAATPGSEERSP